MGKRIDITEKLSFDENPVIIIKEKEIEVNTDASTMLKLLAKVNDGDASANVISEMAELLFTKRGKKNLDSLNLNLSDYSKVVEIAMDLATGDTDEGEPQENDGTTSLETGI